MIRGASQKYFYAYWASVAGLFFLLLFFAAWHLPQSPAPWFDEGINLGIAKSLVTRGVYSLQIGQDEFVRERQFLITTNYPVLLPVAGSLWLFGMHMAAARLPMAVFLLCFAILSFATVWKLYGRAAALASLALIVSFVPLYGNGKNVLGEVPGLAYFLAGILLLHGAVSSKRLVCAGICFGLSAATKPFFLLVIPAVAFGELVRYLRLRDAWAYRAGAIIFGIAGPMLLWAWTILPSFSLFGIASTVGYYANSYAATHVGVQVFHNAIRFVTESTPMHVAFLFAVSVSAMILRWRRKDSITETEAVLWFFIMATMLWYLKTPGWYRYFFPAHMLLFFLFPFALFRLSPRAVAITVCVALFIFQLGFLASKRHDPLYDSSEAADAAAFMNRIIPDGTSVLAVNAPSVVFLMHSGRVSQMLQINPLLFFGGARLSDRDGLPYAFVLVNGTVVGTPLETYAGALASSYRLAAQFGHYALYQHL